MQSFISILLAIVLTFSLSGGLGDPAQTPTLPSSAPAAVVTAARDTDWADMKYVHYDPETFFAGAERLKTLASGRDGQAVIELYDALYDQILRMDTLDSIAYVRHSADVTDEYWSAESVYCDAAVYKMKDALCTACYAVTQGPCADAFSGHVGSDAFGEFLEYEPMTERQAALLQRQSELVDEYRRLMNDAGDVTYSYLGETWTPAMLSGFPGRALAYRDYDGYLEVYYGLHGAVNQMVGPVYLSLVQLRDELAGFEDEDNYAALAYRDIFGRDYTLDDAQALCQQVKAFAREYFSRFSLGDFRRAAQAASPIPDGPELISLLGQYAGRLDPMLEAPWQFMTEHGLYDLSDAEDRAPGAYTITLSQYGSAFVFATLHGTFDDLGTLTHEFGHFVNDYYAPVPNILTSVGSYDLMEIHSTGLEMLFTAFYGEIYETGAEAARCAVLADAAEALIDGCVYDEFQRRIYAQPDMTLPEMNRLFASVCAEYGMFEPMDVDYDWVYVPHNFESPLYYISYAASALAAIQIWEQAQADLQAGVDAWKAVMGRDAYTEGYMSVLEQCGLRLFTEPGAVGSICRPLLMELNRLQAGAQY